MNDISLNKTQFNEKGDEKPFSKEVFLRGNQHIYAKDRSSALNNQKLDVSLPNITQERYS